MPQLWCGSAPRSSLVMGRGFGHGGRPVRREDARKTFPRCGRRVRGKEGKSPTDSGFLVKRENPYRLSSCGQHLF